MPASCDFVCKTRKILQVYTHLGRETGYMRGIEEHFPGQLTAEWRASYTPTWEGAAQWIERYLPYVFSGRSPEHRAGRYNTVFEVDQDAMDLGTPNAARASLETWIELLSSKDKESKAKAGRCLNHYVYPSIAPAEKDRKSAKKWKKWYAEQGARIAFIESTGFWWQASPVF